MALHNYSLIAGPRRGLAPYRFGLRARTRGSMVLQRYGRIVRIRSRLVPTVED